MKRDRTPGKSQTGKLLSFRMRSSAKRSTSGVASSPSAGDDIERPSSRHCRTGVWFVLAWVVSVDRLRLAVAGRHTFSAFDDLAFVVAVIMPLAHVRALRFFGDWLKVRVRSLWR
jgi:hypothetical protein